MSIKTTSDTNVSKTEDMIRKMFQNEMPIQFTTIDDVAASYKQRIDAYRKPVYKTQIIITHRLSSIRDTDYIYVLNRGSIIEQGTHLDLMKKKGWYFESIQ